MTDELTGATAGNQTNSARADNTNTEWERNLISRLAMASLTEQRSARRWSIFFRSLLALYLLVLLLLYLPGSTWEATSMSAKGHTALVDVNGVISADSSASADNVVTALRRAFKDKNTRGVVIRINSPGGSPVQAGYIHDEILRLREKHPELPLYAVITDTCASGGYYIAAAADQIYANRASVVGSIGVIYAGFGFVDALDKLGVERRLLTAGENKGLMDPFSPLQQDDVEHLQSLLKDIHGQFIDIVKDGRGDRLVDSDDLFTGLVWTGEQSLELGLVDALGSASYVAREIIGIEEIVDYTVRENYLDRFARSLGSAMANTLNKALELR
ncbi:MAG: S49 family peptidase [Gammaproteobacteria bacterium]